MSLLQLPSASLEKIKAKNNFLKAFHQKVLSETLYGSWRIEVVEEPPLHEPKFSANFIFQETFELSITSQDLPFLTLLEEWSKPWHWNELSESIALALLEEVLAHYKTNLPPNLRLNSFSTQVMLDNKALKHFPCVLSSDDAKHRLDLYAKTDFPFAALAEALSLTHSQKMLYPESLCIALPLKLTSTKLPARAIQTLHRGDIILIHHDTP